MEIKLYQNGRLEKIENRIIKIIFIIMLFYVLRIWMDMFTGVLTLIILITLIAICILSSYGKFTLCDNEIRYKITKKIECLNYLDIKTIYISNTINNYKGINKNKKIIISSKIFKKKSHTWLTICSEKLKFENNNKLLLKRDIDGIAKQQNKYCFSFICEKIKDLDLLFKGYEGNYAITQSYLSEHLDIIKEIMTLYNIDNNRIEVIKDVNPSIEGAKFSFNDIDAFLHNIKTN